MALVNHRTKDGSLTFFNEEVGDFYKAINGALSESVLKHAKGLGISLCNKKEIVVLISALAQDTIVWLRLAK